MLTPLNPTSRGPSRRIAYRVPWTVERVFDTHALVTNTGPYAADFVRVFTHSSDAVPATAHWGQMTPGETAELCLCGADLADAVVTIAWFRPDDGTEYVWRFVL